MYPDAGSPENDDRSYDVGDHVITRRRLLQYGAGALTAVSLPARAALGATRTSSELSRALATPRRGGTLRMVFSGSHHADSLNPATSASNLGLIVNGMIHDSLVESDYQWRVTPALAEEWSVNKTLTLYKFNLRRTVTFHDGKPFSAADVLYTFNQIFDPKVGSAGLASLSPVLSRSGIRIHDKYTISFALTKPDAFFLNKLAQVWFRIIQDGQTDFIHGSGGTGPFRNKIFERDTGFTFDRNPDYWRSGLPYLDGVHGVVVHELGAKAEAVLTGSSDFGDQPSYAQIPQFQGKKDVALLVNPAGIAIGLDIDGTRRPFSDARVRQAMKMLTNRPQFVKAVLHGEGLTSADSLIAPNDPYYPPDLKPLPHDVPHAKRLLEQAGFPSGFNLAVTTTSSVQGIYDAAVLVKQQFGQGGVNVKVNSVPQDQWFSAFLKVPAFMDTFVRQHPINMLLNFYVSGSAVNTSRIKDPKIDAWVGQLQKTRKLNQQKELVADILKRYNANSAEIVLAWANDAWLRRSNVHGVRFSPTHFVDFRRAYLS
jgi:peptide/nickel transport system substrate-binding protein